MADVAVKRLDEFEAIFGGGFRRARAGLGITSFGLAVMQLPPDYADYPEHDQAHDDQEEVYTLLAGSARLRVGGEGGEEHQLVPGVWARVGPRERRKLFSGEQGATVLAIGGSLGAAYSPPEFTEEGAPDPLGKAHHA